MTTQSQNRERLLDDEMNKVEREKMFEELPAKGFKQDVVIIMYKRYSKYYKHWRDYDKLTCILAMIGLILAIVEVRKRRAKFL